MSRLRRVILVSSWMLIGCLGCRNTMHLGGDPPVPPLLALAPADASIIVWLPDLAAAVQGASDYATHLLAGTGWAVTPEKQANWRHSYGFSPLDPNSYRDGGVEVAAGALVLILKPHDKPLLGLKLNDPTRFDAFMLSSQTLEGVPPQRTEQTLGGHRVVTWAPQAEETPPTHCLFYEDYVFAGADLPALEAYAQRLVQLPSIAHDSSAMAAQRRVPTGQLVIWSHRAEDPPQGPMHWSISSTRLDSTGMGSETFEPNDAKEGGALAASPNALPLPALLQRIDPLSFAVLAVGASTGAQPWRSVDKLLQHDEGHLGALEEAFGETTGLSLTREVLPQMGDVMTAGVRWLNLAPPEGGWGMNLPSLLLQIEAGATLEVKDGAVVSKLLERARTYLQEQGSRVQVNPQKINGEVVQVYGMHASAESPLGAVDVPVRCAVWHNLLVVGVGSKGLTRVFDYLTGKPADWTSSLPEAFVAKHVQGHNSMGLLRFGIMGQALANFVRDTPSAPALNYLVGDVATILLRLEDVSTSARNVEGGSLGKIEQRFAVDTSERL